MIKIDAINIPFVASFDGQCSYRTEGPKSLIRTRNGTGILASRWQKLALTLSGSGWLPHGLDGIDSNTLVTIYCNGWRGVTDPALGNVINIPRAFRTDDYAPQGVAVVNGETVPTPLVMAGSVATLTLVPGATQYQVNYCPIITGFILNIDQQQDTQGNVWAWTIEAAEQ